MSLFGNFEEHVSDEVSVTIGCSVSVGSKDVSVMNVGSGVAYTSNPSFSLAESMQSCLLHTHITAFYPGVRVLCRFCGRYPMKSSLVLGLREHKPDPVFV